MPSPALPIRAISLDLDDTLWPMRPTLIAAEQQLGRWLTTHAPLTAALMASEQRSALRKLFVLCRVVVQESCR